MVSPFPTGMVCLSTVSSDVDFSSIAKGLMSFCMIGTIARFSGGFMFAHRLKSGWIGYFVFLAIPYSPA